MRTLNTVREIIEALAEVDPNLPLINPISLEIIPQIKTEVVGEQKLIPYNGSAVQMSVVSIYTLLSPHINPYLPFHENFKILRQFSTVESTIRKVLIEYYKKRNECISKISTDEEFEYSVELGWTISKRPVGRYLHDVLVLNQPYLIKDGDVYVYPPDYITLGVVYECNSIIYTLTLVDNTLMFVSDSGEITYDDFMKLISSPL